MSVEEDFADALDGEDDPLTEAEAERNALQAKLERFQRAANAPPRRPTTS